MGWDRAIAEALGESEAHRLEYETTAPFWSGGVVVALVWGPVDFVVLIWVCSEATQPSAQHVLLGSLLIVSDTTKGRFPHGHSRYRIPQRLSLRPLDRFEEIPD